MKSIVYGTIAAVLIAVVAGIVLTSTEQSSAQKFSTANTRL